MSFLANGQSRILLQAGKEIIEVATWPLVAKSHVAYETGQTSLPTEEDDEGNIVPTEALNLRDDFDDDAEDSDD
jgi:hypothetical protein